MLIFLHNRWLNTGRKVFGFKLKNKNMYIYLPGSDGRSYDILEQRQIQEYI